MRKSDEALRKPERPMVYLVAVSAIVMAVLALSAFGVLDDLLRAIGH